MKRDREKNHPSELGKRSRATPVRPFVRTTFEFLQDKQLEAKTGTAWPSNGEQKCVWEHRTSRLDTEDEVILRGYGCELEGCGFPSSLLKEILLFKSTSRNRISNVILQPCGVTLVWPAGQAPRIVEDPAAVDIRHKKAWLFQVLSVMQWFHSRGLQYSNLLLPNELLEGKYVAGLSTYLKDCELVSPCLLALLYQCILRIGQHQRKKSGYWSYTSPEALLGCENHDAAMDMWAAGCFLFELFDAEPLFKPEDTHTEFSQLIEIYKVMGSPCEATWPGVSRLPHYNSSLPKWPNSQLPKLLESYPEDAADLIRKLVCLDPKKRLSVDEALAHPFFADVREVVGADFTIDIADISTILLRNEPRTHERNGVIGCFLSQKEISGEMRAILVDWLADVAWEFQLSDDALFMAIMLVDRVLQHKAISKRRFQLLGEACILLASKIMDVAQLTLAVLAYISDDIYTQQHVQDMELEVLEGLDFDLGVSNPLYFVRLYVAVLGSDLTTTYLAQYLAGSFLQDPDHRFFSCSCIGLCAVTLAVGRCADSPIPAPLLPLLSEKTLESQSECVAKMYSFWASGMVPPPKIKKLKSIDRKSVV